jgi:phenylalanyl-tRNA synthetase beta chain
MVIDQQVGFEAVRQIAKEQGGEFLKDVILFDVYTGQGIEAGRKSLALGLTWQHPSRTLNEEEINASVAAVVERLTNDLGAVLRD